MSKKDDFFSFGTDDLSEISAGFDRQIDALGATDKNLAKARVLCIRGKFADALKIYEGIVDEDFENVDGYIGILRVHSKNFTVYDGAEIENDVEVIRQISRGEYTKDEEFTAYLTARKKHFEKIAEDKKKKAEADRIAAEKARQKAAEEAKRRAEEADAAKKRAAEEAKRRAEKEAEAKKRVAEDAKKRAEQAAAAKKRAEEEKKKRKEQVKKLYDEKRYIEAFPDILRFAEEGDSDFCFRAGYCYSTGNGVAKDVDKAISWYTKSAEQGDKGAIYKVALYNLGWNYFYNKKDLSKAKYWWEKAAAQGYEDAKKRLNEHFSPEAEAKKRAEEEKKKRKVEVKKLYDEDRYIEAFPDILRFAEEGDSDFWHRAGYCYDCGKGVTKDVDKAMYWYTKSAERGDKFSQYNLGQCYFYDKKDYSKAKYWWEKAAARGHENAKKKLNEHFSPEAEAKRQAEEERKKFIVENFRIEDGVLIKYLGKGGNVTIPNGVTKIGEFAFSRNSRVTSVTIPKGVTEIGQNAFDNCNMLSSVTIPSGITRIEYATFRDCSNLKSVSIPGGVIKIEWNAFYGAGLTSVNIPNSVTEIGEYAFYCKVLKRVTVSKNCNVSKNAFPADCVVTRQ